MKRGVRICLEGAALMAIAGLPVLAQNTTTTTTTTTTTSSMANSSFNTYATDLNVPNMGGAGRLAAIQAINDMNLTAQDIEAILPNLMDLREEDRRYRTAGYTTDASLLTGRADVTGNTMTGQTYVMQRAQGYRDRREATWNLISQKIGQDKGTRLRNLVDPPMPASQFASVWSQHMTTVNTLLADLDREAADRVARANAAANTTATAGTDTNGGNTTATAGNTGTDNTTTTTTTVQTVTPYYSATSVWWTTDQANASLTVPPSVPISDLVMLLEDRLVSLYNLNTGLYMLPAGWEDRMNMPTMFSLWETKLRVWE